MAKSLTEILGYKAQTGVIKAVAGGVPQNILPPAFLRSNDTVPGDSGKYLKIESTREVAQRAHYDDPSKLRGHEGISEVPFKCATLKEHIIHKATVLQALQDMNSPARQERGQQEVDRQTAVFAQRFTNARVSYVYSALTLGLIYTDVDGNLLPSSSTAVETIDFSVPADNKNQLGGIIGTDWDEAGATIIQDVKDIQAKALENTGYPLKYAFYGSALLDYFLINTALKELINGNPAVANSFLNLEIPDGFLGLTWIPAHTALYKDSGATYRYWWATDTVVFTPEPSPDWWDIIQGTYPVPTDVSGVSEDARGAISGSTTDVTGMFSYAYLNPDPDPPSVKHVMGDVFLPLLKVPASIYIADVKAT